MSGKRLKPYVLKVWHGDLAAETFYILAADIKAARLRALDLSRKTSSRAAVAA